MAAAIEMTYREALHKSMIEEMDRNADVFLIGEDIGRYEGTFKVTRGLFPKYGHRRVLDSPITEAGFSGIAIGAAMAGLRPVVEFMTMSFSILALDQIINHAAKVHYMTDGQITVPIVFRGPGGAAKQLSAQHSHSMEGWFAHVPGLKVVVPATPADAYGMLKTAIDDNNPVIFTENPGLYGIKGMVPDDVEYRVPFGKAQVLKEGKDISLVGSRSTEQRRSYWRKTASTPRLSTCDPWFPLTLRRLTIRFARPTARSWCTRIGRAAATGQKSPRESAKIASMIWTPRFRAWAD